MKERADVAAKVPGACWPHPHAAAAPAGACPDLSSSMPCHAVRRCGHLPSRWLAGCPAGPPPHSAAHAPAATARMPMPTCPLQLCPHAGLAELAASLAMQVFQRDAGVLRNTHLGLLLASALKHVVSWPAHRTRLPGTRLMCACGCERCRCHLCCLALPAPGTPQHSPRLSACLHAPARTCTHLHAPARTCTHT